MFSEANTTPEIGTQLIEIMGINAMDLQTPSVASKYKIIAEYFGRFEDAPALARRITKSARGGEKLDRLLQYTLLRKDLDGVRSQLNELPSQDTITSEDPEVADLRSGLSDQEARIINEIQYYE